MRKKRMLRFTSVVVALCMTLTCISFAFTSAIAATTDNSSVVSAPSAESVSAANEDNFTWDNATVYFLLTDRFRNGDESNDHSYNRGLNADGSVADISDDRATFHGGDFVGITQTIEEGYFDDLGVNALWISAPYEQIHGYVVGSDDNPSYAHYSYHGYYVLDYTETDANFGTAEEFKTLVDTAHEHGIRVVLDIVMNHSGYNSTYDMNEYGYGTIASNWTNTYYNFRNINNTDYHSVIDYDSSVADWANWWGADWIRCGVAGYTAGGGDDRTMSLAGLPDFRTESTATVGIPQILQTKWSQEGVLTEKTNELNSYFSSTGKSKTVSNYLAYWLSDWVREYGVDGFRCDTAKHVEYASWKNLKQTCVDALNEWRANNPDAPGADWDEDFWMTGEVWDHGVGYDEYYSQGGFDSLINFSTCGGGALSSSSIASLYQGYADSINTRDDFNVLSFISSHDELLARGDQNTMIYYGSAFLLLPGAVQIYYGDESNRQLASGVAFDGYGGSGHSLRSDMNWDSMDETELAHWQKVGTFRNNHVAIGAGANTNLSATSGVAFARTYDKNGITDKAAAVIAAGSNANVTIDVSAIWSDGQQLVNAYDQSSATVSNGKVTFNSGANGTILIQEPDGRPLMSVSGEARFKGTQTVTVTLEDCDSAKCSIDGGNKFLVYNGSTFEIGSTAYEGDTITITLEAENEKGSSKSTATFVKAYSTETIEPATDPVGSTTPVENPKLYIKTYDGSAPYAYVWTGTSTALLGAWPGTKLTEKNSDGYYVIEIPATGTYSAVLSNGSGAQSGDITGLSGDTYLSVDNSSYKVTTISTGSGSYDPSEPVEGSVTITVEPYSSSATYYIYLWDNSDNSITTAWPGDKLTEKDENGNYVYTVEGYDSVNAIINTGSGGGQTGDISSVVDGSTIQITNEGCTTYKLIKPEVVLSGYQLLKKEAREVLAMNSYDYTASSWSAVTSVMTKANSLIEQGEEGADEDAIAETTTLLQNAKAALVLANPALSYAVKGSSTICGVTVQDADVTVTVNGNSYKTNSDDITGEFTVTATALTASSVIKIDVSRNGNSSQTYSYSMSNGDITEYEPPVTTAPATTVAPTTSAQTTVAPTTAAQTTTGNNILIGDVNLSGVITIDDATLLQRCVAEITEISGDAVIAAECNGDGEIDIRDVTCIQLYLADFKNYGNVGSYTGVQPTTASSTTPVTTVAPTTVAPTTVAPTTDPVNENYIYFKNTSGWSAPYAYYWSNSDTTMTSWPGVKMDSIGDNVYRIEVPQDAECIIFSNNGSPQTGDLTIPGYGYIYNNGWSEYTG